MTNYSIIENKVTFIREQLEYLKEYKNYTREQIESIPDIRLALERLLYLVVQATVDLAELLISDKKLRKPTTLREAFYILNENKIITQELTNNLAGMVGFRNVIAHGYANINYDIVYDVLHNRLKDIEEFIKIISEIK